MADDKSKPQRQGFTANNPSNRGNEGIRRKDSITYIFSISNGIMFPTNETGIPILFILEEKLSSQTPLPQSNKKFPWNLDEEQIHYWPITRTEKTGHRFIDQFIPVRKSEDIKKYQTKEAKITLCEWRRTNPNPKGKDLRPITLAIVGTREFGERIASLICFPWDTNQS